MGRTVSQKIASLPAGRRRRVKKRAAALIREEMSLADLRKALGQTQAGLARSLGVRQDTVSRYERQTDVLLSTLRHYIDAMGGELTLVAEFPNRPPVRISQIAELSESTKGA
jgi:DNA-binding XRE family transcriptional regulator